MLFIINRKIMIKNQIHHLIYNCHSRAFILLPPSSSDPQKLSNDSFNNQILKTKIKNKSIAFKAASFNLHPLPQET